MDSQRYICVQYRIDLGLTILGTIHNLSRNKKGLKQLREKKAFDILMECKQAVHDENDKKLTESFWYDY